MRVIDTPTTHRLFVFFSFFSFSLLEIVRASSIVCGIQIGESLRLCSFHDTRAEGKFEIRIRRSFIENLERSKMKLIKCIIRCC